MNLLITGISGLLGNNLGLYFSKKAEVTGFYRTHQVTIPGVKTMAVDLSDYPATRELVRDAKPDVVIHCASRTDVDGIEMDREGGWLANVWTTRVLLDACRDNEAKLIFISTDAVYSGVQGPYSESSSTGPCNWYGSTKLEAEKLVAERAGSLILRTNIYGWNIQDKESLAEWFLNRLRSGQPVKGFRDALFSSIYTFSLAAVIEQCLEKELTGMYNCGCADSWSKFEFGCHIAELFGCDPGLLEPSRLDEAGLGAARGHDLSLDVRFLAADLGRPLPSMIDSLRQFYHDWQAGVPQVIKKNKEKSLNSIFYPIRQQIPYGSQAIDEADIEAVVKTLKSPYLTQGPMVRQFEEGLTGTVGAAYAVAVNSGTSALHIACLAAGVGPGDEVITSPNTFVASANCAVYCGARPVFADIDPRTYNISPEEIEKKITEKTKAVIPVHFAGQSCDMSVISDIVRAAEKKYGHKIFIIEDACHALGSKYRDRMVGSCTFSDMAVNSFHPVKHITTGEGGAVLTNDETLCKKLRLFRSHGITNTPGEFIHDDLAFQPSTETQPPLMNPWYYEQVRLGYNYRITDIQCALGSSQLKKLDKFRDRRRQIVNQYNEVFSKIKSIKTPFESPECDSNFHLYVLLFNFNQIGIKRAQFMSELKKQGVQTQVHYIPVHTQPYFQKKFATKWGDCPNAEQYYQECLSIPLYPLMTEFDIERVIHEIRGI